jgi:hypothetical protein
MQQLRGEEGYENEKVGKEIVIKGDALADSDSAIGPFEWRKRRMR